MTSLWQSFEGALAYQHNVYSSNTTLKTTCNYTSNTSHYMFLTFP